GRAGGGRRVQPRRARGPRHHGNRAGGRRARDARGGAPARGRRHRRGRTHPARVHPRRGGPVADRPPDGRRAGRERGMSTENTVMDITDLEYPAEGAEVAEALAPRVGPLAGLRQTLSLSWRTLVQIKHNPAELIDFSVQPVMFLLLFT